MQQTNEERRKAFERLSKLAEGQWDTIFQSLAPALLPAVEAFPKHVDCPVHGGKNDLRLFKDYLKTGGGICSCMDSGDGATGFHLLCWVNGWSFKDAVREVATLLGESYRDGQAQPCAVLPRPKTKPEPDPKQIAREEAERRQYLTKCWTQAVKPGDDRSGLLMRYFSNRGLDPVNIPPSIRLHPGMKYRMEDGSFIGPFPVLLAPICRLYTELVSLHRTYLDPAGVKAQVPKPKKAMTPVPEAGMRGGAIPLSAADGPVLNLTEGLETGLAVLQATGVPTWVCTSTSMMRAVEIPAHVTHVVIWADKDRPKPNGKIPGLDAATSLGRRLRDEEGRQVVIRQPQIEIPSDENGIDWCDVYAMYGPGVFTHPFLDKTPAQACA
jgi:putative DNA primase/helicase